MPIKKETMKNNQFSLYKGGIKSTIPTESITLEQLNNLVRSTDYIEKIKAIRAGNKSLKKTLDYITPSGCFSTRNNEALIQRSNIFCLDFDHVNDLRELKANLLENLTPTLFFDSPSGNGLKVFYCIDIEAGSHSDYFKSFQNYFRKKMKLEIDKQCSDISRACFLSWDCNSYYNYSAPTIGKKFIDDYLPKPLTVNQNNVQSIQKSNSSTKSYFEQCEVIKTSLDKTESFISGNRNHYVGLLSCGLNRIGIDQNTAFNYLLQFEQPDFKSNEINNIVKHSYKQTNLHACNPLSEKSCSQNNNMLANIANVAKSNDTQGEDIDLKNNQLLNMPYIPDEIFDNLPVIFKKGSEVFENKRQRDVFLTGALTILSGCMKNVFSLYNGEEIRANLYTFVVAPAASGKSGLASAKALGQKYHNKLLEESEAKMKAYTIQMQVYKKKLADKKYSVEELEMPEEPPFKVLFIPANNSSARVIQHLKEGDQNGIFCETEADSMGNVLKQDWGGYSDLLRKAFHHEPISYSRKTNKEYVEINKAALAVALAGTPGQVINLIKSSEDGLFSRFLFYVFKSENIWMNAAETSNGVNLTAHFNSLGGEVLHFVEFLETKQRIDVKLSPEHWMKLNDFGRNSLVTLTCLHSEDMASTSKRLGLILLRLCMILTAQRYYDSAEIQNVYHCADEDFEIALKLVKVYEQHAVFMFNELPKSTTGADKALKKFFDLLPDKFQRKEAIELALNKLQIKERTADGYLSKLLTNKLLDNPRSGYYEKIR